LKMRNVSGTFAPAMSFSWRSYFNEQRPVTTRPGWV